VVSQAELDVFGVQLVAVYQALDPVELVQLTVCALATCPINKADKKIDVVSA
jgi:hypothetical protein